MVARCTHHPAGISSAGMGWGTSDGQQDVLFLHGFVMPFPVMRCWVLWASRSIPPEPRTEPPACSPLPTPGQHHPSRCRSDPHPDHCGAACPTLTPLRSLARLRDTLSGGMGPCEGMGMGMEAFLAQKLVTGALETARQPPGIIAASRSALAATLRSRGCRHCLLRHVPSSPAVSSAVPTGLAVPPLLGCPWDRCTAPESLL